MRVHVFGNIPSPAIVTFGLHKIAADSEDQYGTDVNQFIERDFYINDGLVSLPTVEQTVDLIHRTQEALKVHGNLRLHKIASNEKNIMKACPNADLAMVLKDLSFEHDNLPLQRSLCLF